MVIEIVANRIIADMWAGRRARARRHLLTFPASRPVNLPCQLSL
jgi:hypothetical protein